MSDPSLPPQGWYPDPSGARGWRVWNGQIWTEVTRPYGAAPEVVVRSLASSNALRNLAQFGVVSYFGGLGLLADVFHHHHQLSAHETSTLVLIGVVLALIGHFTYARCLATATPHRLVYSEIPFVNVIIWADQAPTRPDQSGATNAATQLLLLIAMLTYTWSPLPSSAALSVLAHLVPGACAVINLHWVSLARERNAI